MARNGVGREIPERWRGKRLVPYRDPYRSARTRTARRAA